MASKKIKPYVIEWHVGQILKGVHSLDKITDEATRTKVAKALGDQQRHAAQVDAGTNRVTLYGLVVRQSEKAVLFRESDNARFGSESNGTGEAWWPLSQVRLSEAGGIRKLDAPAWLVREKQKDATAKLDAELAKAQEVARG